MPVNNDGKQMIGDTKFNSSYFYGPLDDDPYSAYRFEFKKEKEYKTKSASWQKDAIPDEAFEEAERYAKVSPYIRKGVPDDIENVTVGIFANLYELMDKADRREVKNAVNLIPTDSPSPVKKHSRSYFLQTSDSNFSNEDFASPVNTQNVIQNIFNAIAEIFFGWSIFDEADQKTSADMNDLLRKDKVTWKSLSRHYTDYFQVQMNLVFDNAEDLLKERLKGEESAYYQRICFYAGLVIATLGKIFSQNYLVFAGLASSSIMFGFMAHHYINISLSQRTKELTLKVFIDEIYNQTASHRLPSNTNADG